MVTQTDTERFLPYVPRLVREWLDSPDPDATHRVMEGSTIFADISGFTKLSERLARIGREGAEEVTEVIGKSFSLLLEPAYSYGGTLVKFGGDALLLFYRGDGHEQRAASAALEMRRAMRAMGTFETPVGKVTLRMSQGVHSGTYDIFLVGSSMRELIMAGSSTTQLGRLEGAANAGQIVVSEATARALPTKNIGDPKEGGFFLRGSLLPLEEYRPTFLEVDHDLAPFVPTAVREAIAAGAIAAEHRPITTAFVRFTGLDALISKDPTTAAVALGELIDDVEAATRPRDIASLNADVYPDGVKLLLTAGAPVTTGEDEENMLFAMREVMEKERPLPLHIGVTRGPAFAGDVGAMFRRGYTVMGDEVNLAARLMSKAGPNQILAIPEVVQASRTLFETTAMEPFMVKGKSKPITAYAVGPAQGARLEASGHNAPFRGRDEELDLLRTLWDKAKRGEGSAVIVGGPPGLGKSRLLNEFAKALGGSDVFQAVSRRYRASTPYFAAGLLLGEILGTDREITEASLRRLVDTAAPELEPYLSLLGDVLGLDIPESGEVKDLAQEFRKSRLEDSVATLLTALLPEPTLLWFDDGQWMDDASADLVVALAGVASERPWILAVSGRAVEQAAADRELEAPTITLGPLSPDDATAIVHQMTEAAPLPAHVTTAIVERSQGNPMFLLELLAASDSEDVDALPESIDGLISARIDRLAPEDRNALRQLAVLGSGFRPEYAEVVLPEGASPAATFRRLADFVEADDEWVRFSNSLVHSAAYSGLPYRQRRQLHGRIAESIERSGGSPDLMSIHYSAAARWPEAWKYSQIAGDHAKEIYANIEAESFYERALEAARHVETVGDGDRVRVLTSLGDVRVHSGSFDGAFDAYRRASRLVEDGSVERSDLHLRRSRARLRVGSYQSALRETTAGYRNLEARRDREAAEAKARLAAWAASIRLQQGELRKALQLAEEALEQGESCDEREALAQAYIVLDGAHEMLGEPELAVYADRAREIYEEEGNLMQLAVLDNNAAVHAYDEGRWDDAIASYTGAQEAVRRIGNLQHAASAGANIGEVLVSQGHLDEAETILRDSIRDLRAYHLIELLPFAEIQLARLEMERGNLGLAIGFLDQIYDDATAGGRNDDALEAAIYLADALVRSGVAERALATLDAAEAQAGDEAEFYEASLLRVRAQALALTGDLEGALALTEKGLAVARDHGLLYEEALLLRAKGEIADDKEAVEEANRLLHRLGVVQSV